MTNRIVAPPSTLWTLTSQQGPGNNRIPLSTLPWVVGRRTGADLFLAEQSVSGRHAEFFEKQGALHVRDLGSTNGTFVNGVKVEPQCESRLVMGDLVQFGRSVFRVTCDTASMALGTRCCTSPESVSDWALALSLFDKLMTERAIVPFYQPIVADTPQGPRTVAYEVLGRSRLYGLDQPTVMFQAATQLNQEAELSHLFRKEGLSATPERSLPHLFLNTHPNEMRDLTRLILSLREIRRINPEREITLEIHESAIAELTTMKMLRLVLTDLKMGLAYDDFGVGQARIAELAETSPDYVKFDMQLVRGIHRATHKQQQVLGTLVRLVNELGIAPLAEGVECEEEADVCRQLGFHLFQGFFFGRPAGVTKYFA